MRFQYVSYGLFWLITGVIAGILGKGLTELVRTRDSLHISSLVLGQQTEEINLLKEEVQRLRAENEKFMRELLAGQIGKERVEEELFNAKAVSGILPVEGPGVQITLADATDTTDPAEFSVVESGLVHDYDILYLLNELRAGGAEAISIGSGKIEERVVATTFIRCTGPTVVVNGQKLTAPFVVKAIGDPQILYDSLLMRGGIIEQLKRYGLMITLSKEERLKISGYALPVNFRFSRFPDVSLSGGIQTNQDSNRTEPRFLNGSEETGGNGSTMNRKVKSER